MLLVMKKEIPNIIRAIVSEIDTQIFGVWDSINERANVCSTKWARVGKVIKDSSNNSFTITETKTDEWIKAIPTPLPILNGHIQLPVPYFITGTKIATNREWTIATNDLTKKTPIIWLLGSQRFKSFGRESALDFECDLRLFFLDETNASQFYTDDHLNNVVYPMEQLALEFIKTIDKNRKFKKIEDFEITDFARFGVEQSDGVVKNILDANLSGIELLITIKKYKENCLC